MNKYKVVLSSQDKDKALVTVETDAHGSFCFKAKPGIYKVQVCDVFGLKYLKAGKVALGNRMTADKGLLFPQSILKPRCAGRSLSFC